MSGVGLSSAICFAPSEFIVVLRDSEGNEVLGCASHLALSIRQSQKQSYGDIVIEDKHDGSYHVQYIVAFQGTLELSVEIRDPASRSKVSEPLIGSPFYVTAVAQQAEPTEMDRALAGLFDLRPVRMTLETTQHRLRPCSQAHKRVHHVSRTRRFLHPACALRSWAWRSGGRSSSARVLW